MREHVIAHGPKGLPQVHLGGGTATESNELAIKVALGGNENLSVLAFDNAHHGNSELTNPGLRAAFP